MWGKTVAVVDVKPFEAQRDEAIATVRESVQSLRALVVEKFLVEEYKNRTRDLDAEDGELERKLGTLSASRSSLQPVTEAKVRVLERQADDETALGNVEAAGRKQQEALGVQQNFAAIVGRIQQTESRRATIVEEKRRIAREIFEERYPSFSVATFAVIECAAGLLDDFKAGMFEYQALTGLEPTSSRDRGLIKNYHVEKLIPSSSSFSSTDRQLAARVAEWFR